MNHISNKISGIPQFLCGFEVGMVIMSESWVFITFLFFVYSVL